MADSPNVNNYLIGKGNVYFTPEGGVRRHMGNCPEFEIEMEIEELEHFSSMAGTRTKDLTVVLERSATITLTLEEWSKENIALMVLGALDTDSEGNNVIHAMQTGATKGLLEFEGTNDVGPKFNYYFPSVSFRPNGALNPISEEWGTMELIGDINVSGGVSFTITEVDSGETETASV